MSDQQHKLERELEEIPSLVRRGLMTDGTGAGALLAVLKRASQEDVPSWVLLKLCYRAMRLADSMCHSALGLESGAELRRWVDSTFARPIDSHAMTLLLSFKEIYGHATAEVRDDFFNDEVWNWTEVNPPLEYRIGLLAIALGLGSVGAIESALERRTATGGGLAAPAISDPMMTTLAVVGLVVMARDAGPGNIDASRALVRLAEDPNLAPFLARVLPDDVLRSPLHRVLLTRSLRRLATQLIPPHRCLTQPQLKEAKDALIVLLAHTNRRAA